MQPYESREPDATQQIPSFTPPPSPVAASPRRGRPVATALLATALIASTFGGGVVGGIAGTQLLAQRQSPPPAVQTEQPAANPTGAAFTPSDTATVAAAVYAKAGPSVVHIVVAGGGGRGNGSGFVVDSSGHILTNQHVVAGARTITVRFANGETRPGTVVGSDRANDVALIKVSDLPSGIPVATLGDSDKIGVGDLAVAIGSPFGLSQTVTQGIISALDRTWQSGNNPARRDLIQTDAPINPGNSGGPLLNSKGEVIGINSLIESPVEGSVGIGFALEINVAKRLLPTLETGATVEPVWLGISGIALDATIAQEQGLPVTSGVLIASVVANGPAAKAGLRGGEGATGDVPRGGDVITHVDGVAVRAVPDISSRLVGRRPGEKVELTIVRDGRTSKVSVTLEPWPSGQGG